MIESHGAVVSEIRGEVTDADGKPVITSVVTVLGEAAHPDEADEVSAQIAARARRRDRENDCWAKLRSRTDRRRAGAETQPRNMFRRFASS